MRSERHHLASTFPLGSRRLRWGHAWAATFHGLVTMTGSAQYDGWNEALSEGFAILLGRRLEQFPQATYAAYYDCDDLAVELFKQGFDLAPLARGSSGRGKVALTIDQRDLSCRDVRRGADRCSRSLTVRDPQSTPRWPGGPDNVPQTRPHPEDLSGPMWTDGCRHGAGPDAAPFVAVVCFGVPDAKSQQGSGKASEPLGRGARLADA